MQPINKLLLTTLALSLILLTPTCFASKPKLLFIQTAQTGTITKMANYPNTYKLQLQNVLPFVTYFSDRPNRITGLMAIGDFIKHWQKSSSSFTKDHPNAGIESVIIDATDKKKQTLSFVVELSKPIYSRKQKTITYTATPLNKKMRIMHPTKLGYTSLFIDDITGMLRMCTDCGDGD